VRDLCLAFLIALCAGLQPVTLFAAEEAKDRSVLLIASQDLADPRFRQSVVLVTRHGSNRSTVGVIVNRPLDAKLDRIFPEIKEAAQHRLHYGGPVAPADLVFMLRGETPPAASIALMDGLFLSSNIESLLRVLGAPTPADRLRVFRGFASWAPYQLESEIDRGDWYLLPVDVDTLFNEPPDGLWLKLFRRATQLTVQAPAHDGGIALAGR